MSEHAAQAAETLLEERQCTAALRAFDHAEASGADADRCSAGRWLAHMLLGNFEGAWLQSDVIRERGTVDPHRLWQGEDVQNKRVILRCLHGLGDAVQLLRYVPLLQAQVRSLVIEVPPPMLELASMFAGAGEVITWGHNAPGIPPQWDVQIEINELPYLFRTQAEDLPIATRYLTVPPQVLRASAPRPRDAASLRVGVVWASGEWNASRGVPFGLFRDLLTVPGCEFWNLQGGLRRADWCTAAGSGAMHDAAACAANLPHLAGLIAQLDLVITPDTLAAHLAGAFGTPALVLLQHAADWRWQHARADSPWYPSLQLIRQSRPGAWQAVIAEARAALQAAVLAHPSHKLVTQ